MGIFEGCLLACDVDGTLISDEIFPKRNFEAIEYFKDEGGTVCLSTGRTAAALSPIVSRYKGIGPSVVANGSMIYNVETKQVLYRKRLTKADKELTLEILSLYPDAGIEMHNGDRVIVINRTNESDDHENYEKIPTVFLPKESIFDYDIEKILFLFPNKERRASAAAFAQAKNSSCTFAYSAALISGKKRYYLEQLPNDTSKAKTLQKLIDMFSFDHQKVFAIGDYYNDLEMIKSAYISACPNTSPDEIKAAADYVVGSPQDGAVADFIEILKDKI